MTQNPSTPCKPLVMYRLGDFIAQRFAVYADCPACGARQCGIRLAYQGGGGYTYRPQDPR